MTSGELATLYPVGDESKDGFLKPDEAIKKLSKPKVHSLCALLLQGVTSGDSGLLEGAFSVTDLELVKSALKSLPSNKVLPLLDAIVIRIQKKPLRSLQLVPWLKILLESQATFLTTVPDLSTRLSPLQNIIDARTKTYRRMVQLRGRIDLILSQLGESQIGKSKAQSKEELLATLMTSPMAVYDESEDEAELLTETIPEQVLPEDDSQQSDHSMDYDEEDDDDDGDDDDDDEEDEDGDGPSDDDDGYNDQDD